MARPPAGMLNRLITNPALYAGWAVLLLVTCSATYFADPYVFAVTTLGITGASLCMCLMGLSVSLLSLDPGTRSRRRIILFVTIVAAESLAALAILRSFTWA